MELTAGRLGRRSNLSWSGDEGNSSLQGWLGERSYEDPLSSHKRMRTGKACSFEKKRPKPLLLWFSFQLEPYSALTSSTGSSSSRRSPITGTQHSARVCPMRGFHSGGGGYVTVQPMSDERQPLRQLKRFERLLVRLGRCPTCHRQLTSVTHEDVASWYSHPGLGIFYRAGASSQGRMLTGHITKLSHRKIPHCPGCQYTFIHRWIYPVAD